jgi:hypothetical protein
MAELLAAVESGQAIKVPVDQGQTARGLRVAISRSASNRGLSVETLEGDGFVAVMQAEHPRTKTRQGSQDGQRRRGRPPKQQEGAMPGMAQSV